MSASMTMSPLDPLVRSPVTPADRLSVAVFFALLIHALILLGVAFVPEEAPKPRFDTMEIILVSKTSEPPPEAQMLAQAALEGGGELDEEGAPASPLPAPLPESVPRVASAPAPSNDATRETSVSAQAATATPPTTTPTPNEKPAPVAQPEQLVAEAAQATQALARPQPEPQPVPETSEGEEIRNDETAPAPTASELIASSFAIASLNAEIQDRLDARAQRPRRKFISANTREYKFAAYMEAWRAKVERFGNINYPDEARRRNLSGALILEVIIRPDGTVKETMIRRSSGHQVLDDAAVRIVEMAAPFAPFPDEIAADVDLLHVTRTWQFLNQAGFKGR